MKGSPKKVLNGKFHKKKSSGETRNKMGGRRLEGHVTDARITRMEKTSRRQIRWEASSEGRQGPEAAVAP